jgi:hypothetical protein
VFVENLRGKMEAALTALDAGLPANVSVKMVTTKHGVNIGRPSNELLWSN